MGQRMQHARATWAQRGIRLSVAASLLSLSLPTALAVEAPSFSSNWNPSASTTLPAATPPTITFPSQPQTKQRAPNTAPSSQRPARAEGPAAGKRSLPGTLRPARIGAVKGDAFSTSPAVVAGDVPHRPLKPVDRGVERPTEDQASFAPSGSSSRRTAVGAGLSESIVLRPAVIMPLGNDPVDSPWSATASPRNKPSLVESLRAAKQGALSAGQRELIVAAEPPTMPPSSRSAPAQQVLVLPAQEPITAEYEEIVEEEENFAPIISAADLPRPDRRGQGSAGNRPPSQQPQPDKGAALYPSTATPAGPNLRLASATHVGRASPPANVGRASSPANVGRASSPAKATSNSSVGKDAAPANASASRLETPKFTWPKVQTEKLKLRPVAESAPVSAKPVAETEPQLLAVPKMQKAPKLLDARSIPKASEARSSASAPPTVREKSPELLVRPAMVVGS